MAICELCKEFGIVCKSGEPGNKEYIPVGGSAAYLNGIQKRRYVESIQDCPAKTGQKTIEEVGKGLRISFTAITLKDLGHGSGDVL